MKNTIILIEDEMEIAETIIQILTNHHFNVIHFTHGALAKKYIQNPSAENINLFIIDRMLPEISGTMLIKEIRHHSIIFQTPILVITALSTPQDIIEGLECGADDYLTKPFDLNILLARTKALIRRSEFLKKKIEQKQILQFKELILDLNQYKLTKDEETIELTPSEFKLLQSFLTSPGKVFTRNQLISSIQEGPIHVTDRTIDTHIFGLRKKLADYGKYIESVRGVGYRVMQNED